MEINQQEEGKRLASLFAKYGVRNRAEFARDFGVPGGGAMIYQHVTGRKPISLEAGKAYARGFGCSLNEVCPRLAKLVDVGVPISAAPSLVAREPTAHYDAGETSTKKTVGYGPDRALADLTKSLKRFFIGMSQEHRDIVHALANQLYSLDNPNDRLANPLPESPPPERRARKKQKDHA